MKLTPVGKMTVLVVVAGAAFGVLPFVGQNRAGRGFQGFGNAAEDRSADNAATGTALAQTDFTVAGNNPGCTTIPKSAFWVTPGTRSRECFWPTAARRRRRAV